LQSDDGFVKVVGNYEPADGGRDFLYQTAVRQRAAGSFGAALVTLDRLREGYPDFSRLHEEIGLCCLALGDIPGAIEAFERGVTINPALLSSWRELERLYRARGDTKKAQVAAGHLATLNELPGELVQAGSLFSDGEMVAAEQILIAFLSKRGNHVEALRLLARIALQRRALDEARSLFEKVLALAPQYRAARGDYARVLIEQQEPLQARGQLDALLRLDPGNCDYLTLDATASAALGEYERAISTYRRVLVAQPGWHHVHLLLGHALKAMGHRQEAIDAYKAAALGRPSFGDAYWSLANLKTYRFAAEEIGRMRAQEAAPATTLVDRYHLCFALGKALEDEGQCEESWRYYQLGNELRGRQGGYDSAANEADVEGHINVCTGEFFAARAGWGAEDPAPIFIVGLPRSGSTLVEQILASHSRVEGTQELPLVGKIVAELSRQSPESKRQSPKSKEQSRYLGMLGSLGCEDFRSLGERYLKESLAYRQGKPFFIDKMPNNFRHIGLIHLMLPKATIIDVRREPMACCVSNLKQLFARGQEFSYSVDAMARYYRSYLRLMHHWGDVLPGRILHVSYEDIVERFEDTVARTLEFCGLEPEPGCLRFHDTRRAISTASSEQVRQPIVRTELGRWRHFEPWLGALKESLVFNE